MATITPSSDFETLKDKQRRLRDVFPPSFGLRIHRALSWLGRSEAEPDDADVRFILLWVGFNAAYAGELLDEAVNERGAFNAFFDALIGLDVEHRIYNSVWERFSQEIRLLLSNRYVFGPFWKHQNGVDGYDDWEERLAQSQKVIARALVNRDTTVVLSTIFDRLYVLRNQLVHGGATWNGSVNRDQVRDGAALLKWLLPTFIDIMMDNATRDWGKPFYPVVD